MKSLAWVITIGAAVVGCGDNLGGQPADGPPITPTPDAPFDATPDGMPDAMPPFTTRLVLAAAQVPTTPAEAASLGMDIDSGEPTGDAAVDNQLGSVLAAVTAQGFDVQSGVDFSIDHGESLTLFDLRADDSLHTYAGMDPMPPACNSPTDTVCQHHLDGTGSFDLVAGAPMGTMPTTTTAMTVGGPGTAVVDLRLLGTAAPLHLQLIGARFTATVTPTGFVGGRLAGAVPATQITTDVLPAVAAAFRAQVALDCTGSPPPGCGCDPGSNGETLISLFDPNADCVISDAEVANDSLIQALFMTDVNIGGVDALSLGIGIDGVNATFRFTPPD